MKPGMYRPYCLWNNSLLIPGAGLRLFFFADRGGFPSESASRDLRYIPSDSLAKAHRIAPKARSFGDRKRIASFRSETHPCLTGSFRDIRSQNRRVVEDYEQAWKPLSGSIREPTTHKRRLQPCYDGGPLSPLRSRFSGRAAASIVLVPLRFAV
uniref:Uncharacterized protein n=1 Tax=Rhodosorus marinus TaxID=101924 RepID=A0A7S2ZNE7_9RHOD